MDYTITRDDQLLRLLKANDETALREIYLRYWKSLYITALRKLRCREVAEELVQNVIVSLWDKRNESSIGNLGGYLNVAIRYQVINYIKSKLQQEKRNAVSVLTEDSEPFEREANPFASELSHAIDNATRQLPEKTRQVFTMSRFEELSVKEIASFLNISEKAVEYHITKSLKILRMHLKDFILLAIGCMNLPFFL